MQDSSLDIMKSRLIDLLDSIEHAITADEFDDQQIQIQLSELEHGLETERESFKTKGGANLNDELSALSKQENALGYKVQHAKEIGVDGLQTEINDLNAEMENLGRPGDLKKLQNTLQAIILVIDPIVVSTQAAQENIELSQEKLQSLRYQVENIQEERRRLDLDLADFEQKEELQQLRNLCLQKARQAQSIEAVLKQHIGTAGR